MQKKKRREGYEKDVHEWIDGLKMNSTPLSIHRKFDIYQTFDIWTARSVSFDVQDTPHFMSGSRETVNE